MLSDTVFRIEWHGETWLLIEYDADGNEIDRRPLAHDDPRQQVEG